MKKISVVVFAILTLFIFTACNKESKNIEGTLEEIMSKIYVDIPEDERPMMLTNIEVTEENIEYYLGTSDIEYESALASESGVGSIAHSVVLVRVNKNTNIEETKTKIKENINPRKWICVGVEDKDVVVENKGDLIILMLIENQQTREKIIESFNKL